MACLKLLTLDFFFKKHNNVKNNVHFFGNNEFNVLTVTIMSRSILLFYILSLNSIRMMLTLRKCEKSDQLMNHAKHNVTANLAQP